MSKYEENRKSYQEIVREYQAAGDEYIIASRKAWEIMKKVSE